MWRTSICKSVDYVLELCVIVGSSHHGSAAHMSMPQTTSPVGGEKLAISNTAQTSAYHACFVEHRSSICKLAKIRGGSLVYIMPEYMHVRYRMIQARA